VQQVKPIFGVWRNTYLFTTCFYVIFVSPSENYFMNYTALPFVQMPCLGSANSLFYTRSMSVQRAHPLATELYGNAVLLGFMADELEITGKMDAEALCTGQGRRVALGPSPCTYHFSISWQVRRYN
jgi:hypothetical protein